MKAVTLSSGALIVLDKEQSWLFGAPEGVAANIAAAGLEIPNILFTTSLRAPGYGKLGPVLRYKEAPLRMNGLSAMPKHHTHGTDYVIESADGNILFSERGDVSVEDTKPYTLAIIKNKHAAAGYGDNVIHWPWPDAEFNITHNTARLINKMELPEVPQEVITQSKEWTSEADIPSNLKTIDGTKLTVAQANYIAKIAKASGDEGKENWAIGISAFQKAHEVRDGKWVTKKPSVADKELVGVTNCMGDVVSMVATRRFGDVITAALHTAYNEIADRYFADGFLSQEERLQVAEAVGPALSIFRDSLPYELLTRDVTSGVTPVQNTLIDVTAMPVEETTTVTAYPEFEFSNDVPLPSADFTLHGDNPSVLPAFPNGVMKEQWLRTYKDDKGRSRWASVSSAAYWDKQGELFTTKAMDWAIDFAKFIGNKGTLRYKHVPGLDGGECDTQIRVGDFLFESGFFYDTPIGLAMERKLKEEPEKWQISLGLAFADGDVVNGQYQRACIVERTMTDRPALPITALSINTKEFDEMKILTEEELLTVAKELGRPLDEVKQMYDRAVSATGLFANKEELMTQFKAAQEIEDTPVTAEDLVPILEGLTMAEWKELKSALKEVDENHGEELVETVTKDDLVPVLEALDDDEWMELTQAIKECDRGDMGLMYATKEDLRDILRGLSLSDWRQLNWAIKAAKAPVEEEDDELMDEELMDEEAEETPAPVRKKTKSIDSARLDRLENMMTKQFEAITSLAGTVATTMAGTVPTRNVAVPNGNTFLTSQKEAGNQTAADEAIMRKLKALEDAVQSASPTNNLYDVFTSRQLNK